MKKLFETLTHVKKWFCNNTRFYLRFLSTKLILVFFLIANINSIGLSANINKKYRILIVDQSNAKSTDSGTGTKDQPYKTINAAAKIAGPGDTVLVFSGIYRERVSPENSGIEGAPVVYMAAEGERVYIKGSEIWETNWECLDKSKAIYKGLIDKKLFDGPNPFSIKAEAHKGNRTIGQVFVEGKIYAETDNYDDLNKTPGTWMVNKDGSSLTIHFEYNVDNPEKQLIEITTRNRIFAPHKRGLSYITVRGFIMEHCANQFPNSFWVNDREKGNPQAGALSTRSGNHWVIENNTIRFANSLGIDCGTEGGYDLEGNQPTPEGTGYHVIRYNKISDNGACGIAGGRAPFTTISYNLIERNNSQGWTSPEVGGIKVHWFTNGLIEGNIVRDNDGHGIWLDNGCVNSRVTRNVVINSRGTGIFTELADGPCLIDNNIVAFTRVGDGIYSHDCSGMTFAHNLLYANSHFGILARVVTNRGSRGKDGKRQLVGAHDISVYNNIFVDNYRGNMSLPMESPRVYNNKSDFNLFINGAQWHWDGMLNTRFVMNLSNGLLDEKGNIISEDSGDISKRAIMADKLQKVMDEKNIAQIERPNFNVWINEPYLTLEWWQLLTGFDKNSAAPLLGKAEIENGAVSKGMVNLSTVELYFETNDEKPFKLINCPVIDGIDLDFYGQKIIGDKILPGPFQEYHQGHNRFLLNPPVVD